MRVGALAGAVALLAGVPACGGGGGGAGGEEVVIDFWMNSGIVAADFNGDGRADIALVSTHINRPPPHDSEVRVYLQAGGGMAAPAAYRVVPDASSMLATDLDNDGRIDLVASSSATGPVTPNQVGTSGAVSVLLARGSSGAFAAATDVATGGNALATTAVQVSGATYPALLQRSPSGGLWLFAQAVPGLFAAPAPLATGLGAAASHVAAGDVDGDGLEDIAFTSGGSVYWMRQQAGGTFAPAQWAGGGGLHFSAILAADLDGDGRADLVVGDEGNAPAGGRGGGAVFVFSLRGGTFVSQSVAVGDGVQGIVVGDLDGDGVPDIAAVSLVFQLLDQPARIAVVHQSAAVRGTYALAATYAGPPDATSIAVADVDGDGRNDLVVDDGPSVFLQSPSQPGTFGAFRPLP